MFLDFGRFCVIRCVYSLKGDSIHALFSMWEYGYTKEEIERSHYLPLEYGVFQKEVIFRKTDPIPKKEIPVKSRNRWWLR